MLRFNRMALLRWTLILCLSTVFASASPQGGERDPHAWIAQAIKLHQQGRYKEAIAEYEAFLARYPDVADVHTNLGAAYVSVGNIEKGLEHYKKALSLGTAENPQAVRLNLGLAYYKAARFREAGQEFETLLESSPQMLQAALLLGDCYFRAGQYRKVIEVLEPFEKTDADDKALIYLLGTSLIYDGQTLRGQKMVDRIFNQGESVEGHLVLGTAQLLVKDYPSAAKEFEKALKLDPECPSANGLYGIALREMSRIDDAAVYFRRELKVNPYDFDANLYLGIYLYKTEQKYDEAQALFERALGVRPGSPDARYHLGLVYLLKGDLQQALKILESVVKDVPDYMEGHAALTTLYYRLGRKEDAKRHRAIVERLRAERDAATPKDMPAESASGPTDGTRAPQQ